MRSYFLAAIAVAIILQPKIDEPKDVAFGILASLAWPVVIVTILLNTDSLDQ